jgi:uncharacterized membrane protein YphA (DoxX/SURF4 family)
MAHSIPVDVVARTTSRPAYQAYQILHAGFTIAPIIAGFDKFFDRLVDWETYLAPSISNALPMTPHAFMMVIGAVEIVAGLLVLLRPRIGGYVVAAWLFGIIANLLMVSGYYDIALRDFGLALGALALARLGAEFGK